MISIWPKSSPDWIIDHKNYRPSNIDTGWRQKYFYKVEDDTMLNIFINIFKKKWNTWEIDNEIFESYLQEIKSISNNSKGGIESVLLWEHVLSRVYDETIEIIWEKVKLRDHVINYLLQHSYQFSPRTVIANTAEKLFGNLGKQNN